MIKVNQGIFSKSNFLMEFSLPYSERSFVNFFLFLSCIEVLVFGGDVLKFAGMICEK